MAIVKKFIPIDEVKAGMKTAEVVFNNNGNVLIWEDVVLDELTIERLKSIGVREMAIHIEQPQEISRRAYVDSPERFKLEYTLDLNKTKKMFQTIISGGNLEIEETDTIVESVFQKVDSNRNIIDSINQVRSIDEYTYYHSLNVSMLCMIIGKWLRLDSVHIENLVKAGLLHDIGKAKVPLEILNKPGKLTESEFAEMKKHSEYGYLLVKNNGSISTEIARAILTHHEKEDGSGYPLGLTGDKLNLYSKIITVADIFDAMTANRVYKRKDTPFKVFELMQHGSFGVLDPIVLNTFLNNVTTYYIGSQVRLNTGEIGIVVFINSSNMSKPVVKVGERYIDTSISNIVRIEEFI